MFDLRTLESVKMQNKIFLEHPDALPEDTVLQEGRYSIVSTEEIYDRAFVYKAYDTFKSRFVIIKEFFPKDAFGMEEELYFVRNLETLSLELKAPNDYKLKQFKNMIAGFIEEAKYLEKISYGDPVLRILNAFEDLNTAYIVSNYNQWPSLQDFLDAKYKFNSEELSWVTRELVDSIVRFHKRKIIHRNIQPKNIYFKPGELIIDSIGTCDFLQDIKIFDASQYESKYFAPEIMMHNGVIGTWTDIYAIGKILIDVISMMTDSEDYFDGLEKLSVAQKNTYEKIIKNAIAFNSEKRYVDAQLLKKELAIGLSAEVCFKTPKMMIAVVAMISFISCLLFVTQIQNDTMMADTYYIVEEEEVPLAGLLFEKKDCYFITAKDTVFGVDEPQILMWFGSGRVFISHLEIYSEDKGLRIVDLEKREMEKSLDLGEGHYTIKLFYKINNEILLEITNIEIIE